MADFTIHTLGCGSAKPTLRHQPSSTVIDFRNNLFMVDCGEGAQYAFQRQRLKFSRLGHIFLTHLHGDHVLGLPGLISTLSLHSGGGRLVIHTFEEGRRILGKIFDYFARTLTFDVEFNVIDPHGGETVYEGKSLTVRTVALDHRVPTVGYIFKEKPRLRHLRRDMCDFHGVPVNLFNAIKEGADFTRPDGRLIANEILTSDAAPALSYAHISDTAYMPDLAQKIGPVTLLFHETTYLDRNLADAGARGHSTSRQAAKVAKDAGAKWLLTGHYSSRYDNDEEFRKEALEIFPKVILNREGLITDLTRL